MKNSEIVEENPEIQETQKSFKRNLDQELNNHMKKHFGLSIVNLPAIKGYKRNCRIALACQSSSHKESNISNFNKDARKEQGKANDQEWIIDLKHEQKIKIKILQNHKKSKLIVAKHLELTLPNLLFEQVKHQSYN